MHSSMQNSTRLPELQTAGKRGKWGSAFGRFPVFIIFVIRMEVKQMAQSSDITLNPDVLEGSQGEAVPITDLYGIPVFAGEIEELINTAVQEQAQELKDIRSQVFLPHTDETAENMSQIRSQLFQAEPPLTKTEAADRTADSGNYFLVLEFMLVGFLIILLFYQRYRQKRRKEVQDDIDDYGK